MTIVGTGQPDFTLDRHDARDASVCYLTGLAVDTHGDLLFSERSHYRVRKLSHEVLTTLAGSGPIRWNGTGTTIEGAFGGDGGPAIRAFLTDPMGIAADTQGNIYIADQGNERVRKVYANGIMTTVAGNPQVDRDSTGSFTHGGFSGDGGPAILAKLNGPCGVAVSPAGEVYIADTNNQRIRKINRRGIISTVAGSGPIFDFDAVTSGKAKVVESGGYSGDGGPATKARLNYPTNIAVDTHGNLFIVVSLNNRIRKVNTRGIITTVAGGGSERRELWEKARHTGRIDGLAIGDGGPAVGAFLQPSAIALDATDTLYIADKGSERIRKVDKQGMISTVVGNGAVKASIKDGSMMGRYSGDGGLAAAASLNSPSALAIDRAGNLYIADSNNNRIRIVVRAASPRLLEGKPFPSH